MLARESDLPFTVDGIRPDIIVNPHAMPSRMTIGQIMESFVGNWCATVGSHYDGTIFRPFDIESVGNELEKLGLDRYGRHKLYSGITGEPIDMEIYMGPTYYQRLQKFVSDSIYSVRNGPTDVMTQQPLDGKSSSGGLRIGEMEKDVLVAHGTMKMLREKWTAHSDGYTDHLCRCGKFAIVNKKQGLYKCKYCLDNADISMVETTWSAKLFRHELESIGVGVKYFPTPYTFNIKDDLNRSYTTVDSAIDTKEIEHQVDLNELEEYEEEL